MIEDKYLKKGTMNFEFFKVSKNRRVISYIAIFIVVVVGFLLTKQLYTSNVSKCPYVWHGGSPSHKGSCWCGASDAYCLCTPSLAIDAIIEHHGTTKDGKNDVKILLVYRRDPPKDLYAIPGGFVDVGETVEMAAIREVKEETNLTVSRLEQFRMYSDPARDKRRHTASMVFRVIVDSVEDLHTGDDAKNVKLIPLEKLLELNLAFDHRTILEDYLKEFHSSS